MRKILSLLVLLSLSLSPVLGLNRTLSLGEPPPITLSDSKTVATESGLHTFFLDAPVPEPADWMLVPILGVVVVLLTRRTQSRDL